eukprot:TRINITY_DN1063_c0_g1_i4.p1 TRINITY_DN1063_c0_g1~~TRINITY_DN1063_c0_g1_i4.p1  ORF type:complete len:253 (-),score=76.61 TRINITY_DN1063_c0_g1_i4:184-942(-)
MLAELKESKRCIKLLDAFYTLGDDDRLTQNIVMEYVPDSLENFIVRSKKESLTIPVKSIKKIMKEILEGLKFIHAKNICHRDLKPDNILLDKELNVKLCDFGSSKKLDSSSHQNIPHVVSRYYRAPELLLCHTDYTTKIDIWAAGCILAELFTKDPLFMGKSEGLQLLEIMSILGVPESDDRKYLYSSLAKPTRKLVMSIKEMPKTDLVNLFPSTYKKRELELAIDLIEQLLTWNPNKRPTAVEALKHPFFK